MVMVIESFTKESFTRDYRMNESVGSEPDPEDRHFMIDPTQFTSGIVRARVPPIGLRNIELTEIEEDRLRAMADHSTARLTIQAQDLPEADTTTLLRRRR
jgi:hypothetical protein